MGAAQAASDAPPWETLVSMNSLRAAVSVPRNGCPTRFPEPDLISDSWQAPRPQCVPPTERHRGETGVRLIRLQQRPAAI